MSQRSRAPASLAELPRLSDDDREPLDDGYVAVAGMPSALDPAPVNAGTIPDIARLYRAHVGPANSRCVERTAFVAAFSERLARQKIAAVIAGLEMRSPADVEDRIYNCYPAADLIAEGGSEDHERRLFECGWARNEIFFIRRPLFLVEDPEPLARKWAECINDARGQGGAS